MPIDNTGRLSLLRQSMARNNALSLRNDLAGVQRERDNIMLQRDEQAKSGTISLLRRHAERLRAAKTPEDRYNATIESIDLLSDPHLGVYGKEGAQRIIQSGNLRRSMIPAKPRTGLSFEEQMRLQELKNTGRERAARISHADDNTDKTLNRQQEKTISDLENEKRGLEAELSSMTFPEKKDVTDDGGFFGKEKVVPTPTGKNIPYVNLDKILSGEQPIPKIPKTRYDADSKSLIEIGSEDDPKVLKYLNTVAQLEAELTRQGKAFTPAKEMAREKLKRQKQPQQSGKPKKKVDY